MPAFYVSDLDGTLLRNDGQLSAVSRRELARLLADGLHFSVASARSVVSMRPLLVGLDLRLPVIAFNGAFVSDLRTGQHEIVNAIDPDIAREIFHVIRQYSRNLFVSTFDGSADRVYHDQPDNAGEGHYVADRQKHHDPRLQQTENLAGALTEQVVCLTAIGRPDVLEKIRSAFSPEVAECIELHLFENRYSPGWYWLTVHDRRATKDQAIQAIVQRYGLDDHELVVFGDHTNDVKMFRLAACAVAVANAEPEAKCHADTVIGPNEDDSVVRFIQEHHTGTSART